MDSLRFCVSLAFLVSIGVLVSTVESSEPSGLTPFQRTFHQKSQGEAAAPARHNRVKRQNGVIIDSIFQIPIQTLGAVNNLFKNSVLAFQSWRQGTGPVNQSNNYQTSATSALQYTGSNNYNGGNGYYSNNYYRPPRKYNYQSTAAMRGDLPVKGDGSSYRI